MSPRRTITTGAVAVVVIVCAAVMWQHLTFYELTRHWSPIRKVDSLHSPIGVSGWTGDGLRLNDGRTLRLPGFRKLPIESVALTEATKRGVEIAADGRVYGLVRVLHGCGNDPVREHIARVDLSDLLMFMREGEWTITLSAEDLMLGARKQSGMFSKDGWEVSEFMMLEGWAMLVKARQQ